MEDTRFSNSAEIKNLKKHVMEVYKEATKYCEDEVLKETFGSIRDYDSLIVYSIKLFSALADDTQAEEAKELFKPRLESDILTDVAVFTIVIWAYANADETKSALKVYHHMTATGVAPTSCTYTILLNSLATHSDSDVSFIGYARKYFMEMLDKGMKPHSASFISVFKAIACRESEEKAREFLEQIQAKGFTPDSDVHHFAEGNLAKAMNAVKMCNDLANKTTDKEMQNVFRQLHTARIQAKIDTMEMLGALVGDGYVDEAIKLKRMCDAGSYPAVSIYTSAIQAYLKGGKNKSALKAYQGMIASGVAPNSYTYSVLIKGLSVEPSFLGDAKKCMIEMIDRGVRPNTATYTAVVEGFASQEGKEAEEDAKDLVEVMMDKGCSEFKGYDGGSKGKANTYYKKGPRHCLIQVEGLMLCFINVVPAAFILGFYKHVEANDCRQSFGLSL